VSPNLHGTAISTAPPQAPIVVPTHDEFHDEFSDALRMAAWIEEAKRTISEYF
jgi:hypothetical protein